MTDPITIGSAGVKFIKDSDTVGRTFGDRITSGSTTLYTCPAAKKFYVLFTNLTIDSRSSDHWAYINANGIKVGYITGEAQTSTNQNYGIVFECCLEIAAGQTVTLHASGESGTAATGMVFGVETDA